MSTQADIVAELYRRRDSLNPEKRAIVDELAKRHGIGAPEGSAAGRFFSGIGSQLNPVTMVKGVAQAAAHPIDTITGIGESHGAVFNKAVDAYKRGDLLEAGRHALGYLIPVIGPAIDAMGDKAQQGDVAGAMGEATGFGLANFGAPAVLSKVKSVKAFSGVKNPNAAEVAATGYLEKEGVPVSGAAVTGNTYVKGLQKMADSTPVGAVVAGRAEAAAASGLGELSGRLANRAAPAPVVAEQAGAGVRGALESKIAKLHGESGRSYAKLREIEADPANLQTVEVGLDPEGLPVYKDVALPVDMRPVKAALKPTYDRIKRTMPLAQQQASQGLRAIENILNEDDFKSASAADSDLSAIKGVARGAESPHLRDVSQGLAAKAVSELEAAVQAAVGKAVRTVPSSAKPAPAAAPAQAAAAPAAAAPASNLRGVVGDSQTTVAVPGQKGGYPAQYEVRELADVQASHNGQTFQKNPNYPHQNDRDYTRTANQGKIVEWSTPEQFDPTYLITDNADATNGPMVLDANGNALGGNGRKMILDRVYSQDPQGGMGYRALLERKAANYGADPEQVRGMKQPVLVRRLTGPVDAPKAITDFNKSGTAALRASEQAVADSRRVSVGTLDDITGRLEAAGPDATLADILDGPGGPQVLDRMVKDGVLPPQERAAYVEGAKLNEAGRKRVSQLMLGRFFKDPAQLDAVPLSVRGKLERIAAPLAKTENTGFSLADTMASAVELIESARAHGSATLTDYIRQGGLFIDQQYSPEAITMARHLQSTGPLDLTKRVRQYASDASFAEGGASMFGDTPTPAKSFTDAFGGEVADLPIEAAAKVAPPPAPPKPQVVTSPAGKEAVDHLTRGRAMTREKYEVADVVQQLRQEPVQLFNQLTYAKDSGVELLRSVAKHAPGEMAKVSRAFLEGLFDKATAEGGFQHAAKIAAEWAKLGDETKAVLFKNPMLRADLDKFFLGAKKLAENPNPSGSGVVGWIAGQSVLTVTNPATGIPYLLGWGAVSKMLHSPRGIRLLTEGMRIPLGNKAAAGFAAGQILKAAGDEAQPIGRGQSTSQLAPAPAQ